MAFLVTDPLPASAKDRSHSGKIPKANFSGNIEYYDRQGNRDYRAERRHFRGNDWHDDHYYPHHRSRNRSGSYMYQRPDGLYIHWGDGKERRDNYYPRRHHRLREGSYMYQRPDGLYIHWGRDKHKGDH